MKFKTQVDKEHLIRNRIYTINCVYDEVLDESSLLKHDPKTVGTILPSVEPEITYDSDLDSGSTESY